MNPAIKHLIETHYDKCAKRAKRKLTAPCNEDELFWNLYHDAIILTVNRINEGLASFESANHFCKYVTVIAINLCFNWRKKAFKIVSLEDKNDVHEDPEYDFKKDKQYTSLSLVFEELRLHYKLPEQELLVELKESEITVIEGVIIHCLGLKETPVSTSIDVEDPKLLHLLLKDYYRLKAEEIALIFDISVANVNVRTVRYRQEVLQYIKNDSNFQAEPWN